MRREKISIVLTKRQRRLALRYGYPFEDIRSKLEKGVNENRKMEIAEDAFWWEQLVGNLAMSLNHGEVPDDGTYDEVDALADIIERELRYSG